MAAVDYFLKIDGVPGEATDDKHKNEIDVESWSWGATQTGTFASGGGGGAGKVQFQDFQFATALNRSSPMLMLKTATGERIKSAILTARKAGDKGAEDFLKVTLTDVLVSSYQTGGAATPDTPVLVDRALSADVGVTGPPDLPRDSIALRYASLKLTQGPQQHIDLAPAAIGMLAYDPKTGTFRTGAAEDGVLTVGTGDGVVTRGVVKFDVADLKGLLGSPVGGRLTLAVSEIRSPRDPGARLKPDPNLLFDVILYAPSDLALVPDDATREGRRIGSPHLDPRGDPTSLEVDLTGPVRDGAMDTLGIRLELRGAPVRPPIDPGQPPDRGLTEDDGDGGLGRNVAAAFTVALAFDTA